MNLLRKSLRELREFALIQFAIIGAISVTLLCGAGCKTPRLEPGGAYAPTNAVGQVTVNNLGLEIADQTYKLAYDTIQGAFKFERDNRAQLATISPKIKQGLDVIRPKVVEIEQRWALARQMYKANPTPAGLTTMQTIVAEIGRLVPVVQAQLQPAYQAPQPQPPTP